MCGGGCFFVCFFFCFFFLGGGSSIWSVAKEDRAALIGIRLAKTLWVYCCYCGGRKVSGFCFFLSGRR